MGLMGLQGRERMSILLFLLDLLSSLVPGSEVVCPL